MLSTISGGCQNRANGNQSSVAGGRGNMASGDSSTVAGGLQNNAAGSYSFAAGRQAKANHSGAFVWADGTGSDLASTAPNQFLIRAAGGVSLTGGTVDIGSAAVIRGGQLVMQGASDHYFAWFRPGEYDFRMISEGTFPNRSLTIGDFTTGTRQDRLSITSAGNVGIGTGSPTTALGVNGGITANYLVCPSVDITGNAGPLFGGDGKILNVYNTNNVSTIDHYAMTAKGSTAIKATSISGNIARLGTPSYAGDFTGSLRVSGTVTANGVLLTSDRNAKMDFAPIDAKEMLRRTVALPLERWSYTNAPAVPHIGPMAQDFYAAFNLGEDDKHIFTVDADGVAFACIQALHGLLGEKEAEISELKKQVAALAERTLAQEKSSPDWQDRFSKLELAVARIVASGTGHNETSSSKAKEGQ
jgi:hypothetical protein